MGKFLRVLVIFIFLLSIGALVLGCMLFLKRELLKGRTEKLEKALMALGPFIEAEAPTAPTEDSYPERDVAECTDEILQNPDRKDFWSTYKRELEEISEVPVDLQPRTRELRTYYKRDPITEEIMLDDFGRKRTDGEGTMQAVLDYVHEKVKEQYERLNATREELKKLRLELIDTINDLNVHKAVERERNQEITQLKAKIRDLEAEIADLKAQIVDLKATIQQLRDDIEQKKAEIAQLQEEKANLEGENARLKREIEKLREGLQLPTVGGISMGAFIKIEPGQKGTVKSADEDWKFAVLEFSDEFIEELRGPDPEAPVPNVELIIMRPAKPKAVFVTKVKLVQLKQAEKLGVADILADWSQMPAQPGDLVLYP